MIHDPKDKDLQQGNKSAENDTENVSNQEEPTGSNWDSHQQIDEEGNEIGPDDIK